MSNKTYFYRRFFCGPLSTCEEYHRKELFFFHYPISVVPDPRIWEFNKFDLSQSQVYVCDFVCDCVYVYVCVYMYVCMYMCVCVCMCVWLCVCDFLYVCECDFVYVCVCMCVTVYMCVSLCVRMCACVWWMCVWLCVCMCVCVGVYVSVRLEEMLFYFHYPISVVPDPRIWKETENWIKLICLTVKCVCVT